MLNQINHSSKAILFLQPPYGAQSEEIRRDTNVSCRKSKLTLIKIIQSKDYYDYGAFVKLIQRVVKHPNKPITVIIDEDILYTPINTVLWAVLGTLLAAKLIIVATYERYYSDILLQELDKHDSRLLQISTTYFKRYYHFNWDETIGKKKTDSNHVVIKDVIPKTSM